MTDRDREPTFGSVLLAVVFVALLAAALLADVPLKWTVQAERMQPVTFDAVKGETLALEASFTSYGRPFQMAGKPCAIFWQTNGMGSAWWQGEAAASSNRVTATFTPAMDPGADQVLGYIGSTGDIYRAAFAIRFKDGPGAVPNVIEQPPRVLDLAHTVVINPPWPTQADFAAATNYTASATNALSSAVAATSNALSAAVAAVDTRLTGATNAVPQIATNAAHAVVDACAVKWLDAVGARMIIGDYGINNWWVSGMFSINGLSAIRVKSKSITEFLTTYEASTNIAAQASTNAAEAVFAAATNYTDIATNALSSSVAAAKNALSAAVAAVDTRLTDATNAVPQIATNAAEAVFAASADYALTNLTAATLTLHSGEIGNYAAPTNFTLALDFADNGRSGDCILYVENGNQWDSEIAITPDTLTLVSSDLANALTLGRATTNVVTFTRLKDGVVLVSKMEVKQ